MKGWFLIHYEMLLLALFFARMREIGSFTQSDYIVKHHRIETKYCNERYFQNMSVKLVPMNRTRRAFNVSNVVIRELENEIMVSIQFYKFASNEYRLFPMLVAVDYCKIQKMNTFGTSDAFLYTNLRHCPVKKGYYYLKMYRPDESKYPPHMFAGDFKAALKITYRNDKLAQFDWYGSITKVEKW